jgi:hypothetical protein
MESSGFLVNDSVKLTVSKIIERDDNYQDDNHHPRSYWFWLKDSLN